MLTNRIYKQYTQQLFNFRFWGNTQIFTNFDHILGCKTNLNRFQ